MEEAQGDLKRKWNHWIHDTILKTKQNLNIAQARYKENFDNILRKKREVTTEGKTFFLLVERDKWKDYRHALSPVTEGPFKSNKADDKTVVIERPDRSVGFVSSALFVLEPNAKTRKEVRIILKPFIVDLE